MSILAAFGRKTLRDLDTRSRLKGVHLLHVPAGFRMSYALASCLSRGGKYIVSPQAPDAWTYRRSWEDYCRSVRLKLFFGARRQNDFDPRYHVPNPTWMPPPAPTFIQDNLDDLWNAIAAAETSSAAYWRHGKGVRRSNTPTSEVRALRDLMTRNDIIVKPADKNLGLTLIGREWYMGECLRQLSDGSTYHLVDSTLPDMATPTLTARVRREALALIRRLYEVPHNERKWLVANTDRPPRLPEFYILPKLHKDPVKGRPIVASHSWCTTPLSIWCAHRLKPVVDALPTVLRDTRDLVERLAALGLASNADVCMSTADVESLYTNIPIDDALHALHDTLGRGLIPLARQDLMSAVSFVLRHNYLAFDGAVYHQVRGLAMGTPLAPPLANIFMAELERRMFTLHPYIVPLVYVRFLDDIFVVQFANSRDTPHFWRLLESMHPNIRLTRESSRVSVAFMDLVIYREGGRLLHRVHQKALNKYLYISPRSCHPRHMIKGFVRTELVRYARNSSTCLDFLKICRAFSLRLRERGFHPCFLRHVFATVRFGVWPVRASRPSPMVFKVDFGRGSLDHAISRVIAEWYENAPDRFKTLTPKPIVCYRLGKNLYKLLVRARAPT